MTPLGVLVARFAALFCVLHVALASHGHGHGHRHRRFHHHDPTGGDLSARSSSSIADAERLIKQAIAAASAKNKARLEHPKFNKEVPSLDKKRPGMASPLDFKDGTSVWVRTVVNHTDEASGYSLPKEVLEAARLIAESTPQKPSGDQADVAFRTKMKYAHNLDDTKTPTTHGVPEGRLSAWALPEFTGNASTPAKRATGYWQADITPRGLSPFAPSGYKVWRNVRDYGAKGDGTTDDTAAINKAISDGGRCGPNCGSSTVFPATVYFPPGTYLVSTPIIQYYNTELLGDPHELPTILGATSFTGGSLIASDVYVSDDEEWYVNTNNFLRSVRNFKIDIRNTDPGAYVCGIHWQVAQATSIENVEFYMLYNSDVPGNTQQGIYMENGSGGFLGDLTFVGGNFGAYMGNQQFTTSHLVFVNCKTAVQIHWDWAWTMQDIVIESCGTGLTVVGGAGGGQGNGQGLGSLVLVDAIIANTYNGIVTSLTAEQSTSFLLQNVGFFGVEIAVQDSFQQKTLLNGGGQVLVDSWGFGRINNATGTGSSTFVNGDYIPVMTRQEKLLGTAYTNMKPNLFTRRRPKYDDVPLNRIMDVKALGAKGDGVTDDTATLNAILDGAANTSSIVYFPFGSYIISNTLRVPIGSRIIGQAWSQIMAKGPNFADELSPRVAVQFGRPGDTGILEVQNMMFTVSGATAGAIVVEWNVRQSAAGSTGIWDSHIRVGGAKGTDLQKEQCPRDTGSVSTNCKAASLLMHLRPGSHAYLENVWIWTADHDMDKVTQDQINVYTGRGLLVESELAWLWGTSVEHSALYQYQISGARNIMMSMIQTESPYYQPVPHAPAPFKAGLFPNDPTFDNCTSPGCYFSWALRVVDSSTVYILGAGLYSWFSDYSQACLTSEDCQQSGVEIVESHDLWIYNLCTKAFVEMVSPLLYSPTLARDNKNGFLSSILAWLQGAEKTSGARHFTGIQVFSTREVSGFSTAVPETCKTALTQSIECDDMVERFARLGYRGSLGNATLADSVCDASCGKSLKSWFDNVESACAGYSHDEVAPLTLLGGRMWAGYNETCFQQPGSSDYCVDVVGKMPRVSHISDMSTNDVCSYCFMQSRIMMQSTAYSSYDGMFESELEYINDRCGKSFNTTIPTSLVTRADPALQCAEERRYVTAAGDTCDSLATAHSFASAALFIGNPLQITDCSKIAAGTSLCLPLSCTSTYTVQAKDSCLGIEMAHVRDGVRSGDVRKYNPWINTGCRNLWDASENAYGHVICLAPQNGEQGASNTSSVPPMHDRNTGRGYAFGAIADPPVAVPVAEGSTLRCGLWHVANLADGDSCALLTLKGPTTIGILQMVNPSLGTAAETCDENLRGGFAYCVLPMHNWDYS